jgi:uncharacterized protein (TIGR02118 family)
MHILPHMIIVSVLYPKTSDSRFDHDYYMQKHFPLVNSTWEPTGLESYNVFRGVSALDGSPPAYELIAHLGFTSPEHLQNSLAAGAAVLSDIPNFTNVQPLIQINQPI